MHKHRLEAHAAPISQLLCYTAGADRSTAMICARCQSRDIDAQGTCRICGFRAAGLEGEGISRPLNLTRESSEPGVRSTVSMAQPEGKPDGRGSGVAQTDPGASGGLPGGMIEMHCPAPGGPEATQLPPWRVELSKRLQDIRQKRRLGAENEIARQETETNVPMRPERTAPAEHREPLRASSPMPAIPPKEAVRAVLKRSPRLDSRPKPRVVKEPLESLPLFQPLQTSSGSRGGDLPETKKIPAAKTGQAAPDFGKLIDSVVSSASAETVNQIRARASLPARTASKLILVSRTLAGLVDWILIILCAGAFIIAADSVADIDFIDGFTLALFVALIVAIFFVYSIFFLATSNQTIGMMFTDLRLAGAAKTRPRLGQVLLRCPAYLLSILLAGIGLLWAIVDRDGRCLHDRISGTRVERITW